MERKTNSKIRFSLQTLLVVVTCICFYIAGHLNGYRIRKTETKTNTSQVYTVVYSVPLIPGLANDEAAVSEALDDVVDRIKSGVIPASWKDTDTQCKLVPFPGNQSVVLSADQSIHKGVTAFLSQARDVRLAR